METNTSAQNSSVTDTGASNNPPAPKNSDFSNNRIRKMMGLHLSDSQRKNLSNGSVADVDENSKVTAKESKAGEPEGGDALKGTLPPKAKDVKSSPQPDKIDFEAESRKHQSRADQFEQKLKDAESSLAQKDKEISELKQAKQLVEGFTKDPVGFLKDYAPEMYKQMVAVGDPSKLISQQMNQFKSGLDKQFKEQYGQDWSYSESESLSPDSPSFKYKLAYDEQLDVIRDSYRSYIQKQRDGITEAGRAIERDKERLKSEYGFSDDDFKKVDEFASNNKVTYELIAKIALFDKILSSKLAGIVPQPIPPNDLNNTGGGAVLSQKEKSKLSPEMRQIISRIGVNSIH